MSDNMPLPEGNNTDFIHTLLIPIHFATPGSVIEELVQYFMRTTH